MNTNALRVRFSPRWSNGGKNLAVKLLTLLLAVIYYRGSSGVQKRRPGYVFVASFHHLMGFCMNSPALTPVYSNNIPTPQLQRKAVQKVLSRNGAPLTLWCQRDCHPGLQEKQSKADAEGFQEFP